MWRKWFINDNVLCLAVLTVLPCLVLGELFVLDKLPFSVDSAFLQVPWEEARPPEVLAATDAHDAQPARIFYPSFAFLSASLRKADSLLWNPLEFGGMPFFAAWYTRCLSPFSLPFLVFDLNTALRISATMKLIVAGWCAFYAARRFGFGPALACVPAVAFQFSPPLFLELGYPISDVLPWTPILLLFTERTALGQLQYWPQGALVTALMLLGGDLVAVLFAIAFFAFYLSIRLYRTREQSRPWAPAAVFIFAITLGFSLAAVQLAPWLNHISEVQLGDAPVRSVPTLLHVMTLLLPAYFDTQSPLPVSGAPVVLHIGLVALLLAILWLAVRGGAAEGPRERLDTLLMTAAIWLGLLLFLAPLLPLLPYARHIGAEQALGVIPFVAAVGGTATAFTWLQLNPQQCVAAIKRSGVLAAVGCVAVICAYLLSQLAKEPLSGDWIRQVIVSVLVTIAFAGLFVLTLLRPSERILGYGLAAVAAAELLFAFVPLTRYTPIEHTFPQTDFVRALTVWGPQRVGGNRLLADWPLAVHGIPQSAGTGLGLPAHYDALMAGIQRDPKVTRLAGWQPVVLDKRDIQRDFGPERSNLQIRHVHQTGVVVLTWLSPVSRAWFLPDRAPGEQTRIDALELPRLAAALDAEGAAGSAAPLNILEDKNTRVTLDLEGQGPGWALLADSPLPGWSAWVDGKKAEIVPVGKAFRGVRLHEPASKVEFFYEQPWLNAGLLISGIAGLIMCAGLFNLIVHRIRSAETTF